MTFAGAMRQSLSARVLTFVRSRDALGIPARRCSQSTMPLIAGTWKQRRLSADFQRTSSLMPV